MNGKELSGAEVPELFRVFSTGAVFSSTDVFI